MDVVQPIEVLTALQMARRLCGEERREVENRDSHRPQLTLEPLEGELRARSEEHTSELQSRPHLVCRLLLEKKNSTFVPRGLQSSYPVRVSSAALMPSPV